MIELKDFSFAYDYQTKFQEIIFESTSVEINKDKILLVGASGSGKSTFFKILLDYYKPSSGIVINNLNTNMLLQNVYNQVICNTIYDEINLGYKEKFKKNLTEEQIYNYFEIFGVNFDLNKNPHNLSGGQKKMIIIIAILLTKPELIILDEPFVGLDYKRRKALIKFLIDTKIKFILSTHDVEDNFSIYQQIIYIKNKKIISTDIKGVVNEKIIKKPSRLYE